MRVALLIDLDDSGEEFLDTVSGTADRRHYRHSEEIAQLLEVKHIALRLKFVIHIHSHHHAEIHIDQLRGEVKVSLKVGSIYDIDHDVRHILKEVLPHIEFFRAVCRERICAGEIHDHESVSAIFECAFLGIHCHTAVVSYVLVLTGSHIEKGCLAAVRISDEGYLDDLAPFVRQGVHLTFEPFLLHRIDGLKVFAHAVHLLCLALTDDLDVACLLATKRYLVAYHLVLDRISERGIQDHLDLVALHKSHLDYSLTEAAVTINLYDHSPLPCLQFR